MTAFGLIERGDAHEAMHAGFAGELPEGVVAGNGKSGGLDAGFFTVLVVVHLRFEALLLSPAQIHAHKHLGPVLAFGAARARMHGDDGIQPVCFTGEKRARLHGFSELIESLHLTLEVRLYWFSFTRKIEIGFDVAGATREFFVISKKSLDAFAIAHKRLRERSVRPQIRVGEFGFDFG